MSMHIIPQETADIVRLYSLGLISRDDAIDLLNRNPASRRYDQLFCDSEGWLSRRTLDR